jgi:hypothetical protein
MDASHSKCERIAALLARQDGALKSLVPLQEVYGIHIFFPLKLDPLESQDALSGNHANWSRGACFQAHYFAKRTAFSSM